jgi:hypothetical protein
MTHWGAQHPVGGTNVSERTSDVRSVTSVYEQPVVTTYDQSGFVGSECDAAFLLGVHGKIGFEVPLDGSCQNWG